MKDLELHRHDPSQRALAPGQTSLQTDRVAPRQTEDTTGADGPGLLDYWHKVLRHKGLLTAAAIVGGAIGLAYAAWEPRVYQARVMMEVQPINRDFLNVRNVSPTSQTAGDSDFDLQTHVRLLQSKLLSTRTTDKLQAAKHPDDLEAPDLWRRTLHLGTPSQDALWQEALKTAANTARVRAAGNNRIVELACDSTSPQVAADFCNTMAQEYIQQNLESRWAPTEQAGAWLTKQLDDLKIKLAASEQALQTYAQQTGLVFTGEKTDAQEAALTNLQRELSEAQAERINKQSKYEAASAGPPDDDTLKESRATLTQLRSRLAQLKVTYTSNHADVKQVEAQIAALESAVGDSRADIMSRMKQEFEGAQRREALLTAAYAGQARSMSGKAEEISHYNLLRREVDANRLLYDNLLQQLKESTVSAAFRANNLRIVDAADRPLFPYKPDVRQRAGVGLLGGLVLGFVFVSMRERAERTIQDPGDSPHYLALPELGVVPTGGLLLEGNGYRGRTKALTAARVTALSGGAPGEQVEMVSWKYKSSLLSESYRTTLTSILFSSKNGDAPQVIVLTSASPGEGKTTTACNLAIALAEIRQSVLVIDADMRRPRLHSIFGLPNTQGLSTLLLEQGPLTQAGLAAMRVETAVPGLDVLTSGAPRRTVSRLLYSPRFAELISLARGMYDTVIIDTPAMANMADARVIAKFGDAVVLVIRSGVTSRDAALLARDRLAGDGIPVLGTVLNFWDPRTPGYGHYYGDYESYTNAENDDEGGDEVGVVDPDEPTVAVAPAARVEPAHTSAPAARVEPAVAVAPAARVAPVAPAAAVAASRPAVARPRLQFMTTVDDAVSELDRQRGS